MLGLLGTALIGLLLGLTIVVTSQTALSEIAPGPLAPGRLADRRRHRDQLAARRSSSSCIVYRTLPNTEVTTRQVLPGALIATALLQLTFESLPLYVRSVEGLPALKAFGGAAVLLVWLYLMGNVVLIGGAITWWSSRGREAAAATAAVAQRARERERVGPRALRRATTSSERPAGSATWASRARSRPRRPASRRWP